MVHFEYHEPRSLDETVALLQRYQEDAQLLAGGTDLIIGMQRGNIKPAHVISLLNVPGLDQLSVSDGMKIGALVTHRRLELAEWLRGAALCLAEGAGVIGGHQVRNVATIGGNICNASPAADTVPPLLCLDAVAHLVGRDGKRMVPLNGFFIGPGQTVRAPGEILTEIWLPSLPPHSATSFIKIGRRKAMELSILCVAARIDLAADNETCEDVRIALGAVAPTPIRACQAEAVLRGEKLSLDAIREAAHVAVAETSPIDDIRASAEYRRMLTDTIVERAVMCCLDRIEIPESKELVRQLKGDGG